MTVKEEEKEKTDINTGAESNSIQSDRSSGQRPAPEPTLKSSMKGASRLSNSGNNKEPRKSSSSAPTSILLPKKRRWLSMYEEQKGAKS